MKEIGGYFQLEEMPGEEYYPVQGQSWKNRTAVAFEEPQVQENPITVFSV